MALQVLAMSSRSWLSYSYQSRFHLTPLSYETLEYASGFASEQCPEGIVAISTNTLRWVRPGGATLPARCGPATRLSRASDHRPVIGRP